MDSLNLPLIQDAELRRKVVLVRVDHNVVKKGVIFDPYRIDATLGTLFHIVARGGRPILMTHVGRPGDKKTGTIKISDETSVRPIVDYMQKKLHIKIDVPEFKGDNDKGFAGIDESASGYVDRLKKGDLDCIYLPNTRWFRGEEAKGDEAAQFAGELASLADIFVNDAFGSWQAHASTALVPEYIPSYAGFLLQSELKNLDRIYNPERPFLAVVGGAKFDTKIDSLYSLLEKADYLMLGGVIYNAYLSAKYGFAIKGIGEDDLKAAREFVAFSEKYKEKLVELPYIVESDTMEGRFEEQYRTHNIHELETGAELNYVLDVARESFSDKSVKDVLMKAGTIFVNAVMGFAPYFNEGTIALDQNIDENTAASKLYGGGDTMQELKRLLPGLYIAALDHPRYYIFTGGGAVLKAIEQGTPLGLKPVRVLHEKQNK